MKSKKEIEQLAFKSYGDTLLKGSFIHGYTQCQEDMADEISRFLRENLKVVIKQDHKFSKRAEANFDVIVMLGDEQISRTDFTIYS